MTEEITVRLHRTTDLTEAAALWSLGYPLHTIEVHDGRATFVVGYITSSDEFERIIGAYERGELMVEAGEFARRRNETAAKMRKAIGDSYAGVGSVGVA